MKQAVILIHGIGEQIPMDTLRGFVRAVWTSDSSLRRPKVPPTAWSKPDRYSGDFELRRLTTADNRDGRRTDFFEFYWAHLMQGTEVGHFAAWLKTLMFRRPGSVPAQLRPVWWLLLMATLGIAAAIVALFLWGDRIDPWIKTALSAIGTALWAGFGAFVVKRVVGDAARYLHVAPPNIESRRRIREAGIKLLDTLHRSGDYDRIIVAGHSLGSVIGYDILTHYWARRHDDFGQAPQQTTALQVLETLARNPADPNFARDFPAAQSLYFDELRAAGHPWLVSDFVTLGSPLAHAVLLLARTEKEFDAKKSEREFPTCPPVLEDILVAPKTYERKFTYLRRAAWAPHHAAVFAPTRWTNLYFPCRKIIFGDLIGGPIAPAFGPGVRDVAVTTTLRRGLFSHTLYWKFPANAGSSPAAPAPSWIALLREAVRICEQPPPPTPNASAVPSSSPSVANPA